MNMFAATRDTVYQLLAHGRWFSPGTPASSTTKTGRNDIAESSVKTPKIKSNQPIKQSPLKYPSEVIIFYTCMCIIYYIRWPYTKLNFGDKYNKVFTIIKNHIDDHGFEPRSGKPDYKIGICFSSPTHATLSSKILDWLD